MRKSSIDTVSKYYHEKESRDVTVITPEVIEFETPVKSQICNFPDSGIWIIISKSNSAILPQIKELISEKNFDKVCFFVNIRSKKFVRTIENSIENKKIFKPIQDKSILAEVTYGPKILARCIFTLSEQNYLFSFVPYNGGNLSPNTVKISIYLKNGSVNHIDTLILIRKPVLTNLEKEVIQKISAEFFQAKHQLEITMDHHLQQSEQQQSEQQQSEHRQRVHDILHASIKHKEKDRTFQKDNPKSLTHNINNSANVSYTEKLDIHTTASKLIALRANLVSRNLI